MTLTIESTGTATYCPEDDKLRLYVGRVPREEYDFLHDQGWTSTPKQDCDFVATWTPEREDTALAYGGGYLGDEDQSPAERAADRAERYGGYADKRLSEAAAHADKYEAGPAVVGCQSLARAEKQCRALERQADRAVTQWGKAEYWQRRTEGVIANALHRAAPGVRMGRIKELEAEQRRLGVNPLDTDENSWINRWRRHVELRLAYENQMLEAQGGRAAHVDMVPGGFIGTYQIQKVNKSPATGRVVSVMVQHEGKSITLKTERLAKETYRAPTAEELAAFEEQRAAEKKARAAEPKGPSLYNPTMEDAEKLQAIWNAQKDRYSSEPGAVITMTQAQYSQLSKGSYASCQTVDITGGGLRPSRSYAAVNFPTVARVRARYGSVIVIADKPQKPLPDFVWDDPRPAALAEVSARIDEVHTIAGRHWLDKLSDDESQLWTQAIMVKVAQQASASQFGLTELGYQIWRERQQQKELTA